MKFIYQRLAFPGATHRRQAVHRAAQGPVRGQSGRDVRPGELRAHPVGEQYATHSAQDDLAWEERDVHSSGRFRSACLTRVGRSRGGRLDHLVPRRERGQRGGNSYQQVSRLANPLVNELVIGLPDKDKFNGSLPANDAQFGTYVTNPTVPALIASLFGTPAPTQFPRQDLVAVFLTGVAGLNAPANPPTPSEEMRLNTSIPITPYGSQKRLGVIAGDDAGYPDGRRPGDDVVDITLRVAMGKLYSLGLYGGPSNAPSGNLEFTDGAFTNDTHYLPKFPYVMPPLSDSPQPAHEPN